MKTLHLQVFSGLGSRMRAVIGAIAWCKQNNSDLAVHWPRRDKSETSGLFPIGFSDLFVSDWIKDVDIDLPTVDARNWPPQPKEYEKDFWKCRSCDPQSFVKDGDALGDWPYEDLWKPSKEVVGHIESAGLPIAGKKIVGVHIRHALAQPSTPTVDWFVGRMNEICEEFPGVEFFLSCDSLGIEEEVLSRFPGTYHVKKTYLYDRDGIAKAAADLFLLAQCDWMIGSYNSSFSELAGWMRGGKYLPGWGREGWMPEGSYEDSMTPPDGIKEALSELP